MYAKWMLINAKISEDIWVQLPKVPDLAETQTMVSTNSRNHFMDLNKHHENGTNVSMSFLRVVNSNKQMLTLVSTSAMRSVQTTRNTTLWLLCTLMTYYSLLTPEEVSAARGEISETLLN